MCNDLFENRDFDCVVVANGEFPHSTHCVQRVKSAPFLVACDGAYRTLCAMGITPHAVVGDFDSLGDLTSDGYTGDVVHNPDQETNDLTKSMTYVRDSHFRRVLILGATGLREDHTLGNISLLAHYAEWFEMVCLASDFGCFTAIDRTTEFSSFAGQQVSLFSLDHQRTLITTQGLAYPVNERHFDRWWQGTLNESMGTRFTVSLDDGGGWVLVYQTYFAKSESGSIKKPV